jgi:pyruvate dehydrogenase E2 component (dihydrolipoamide acetyltransferase)
MSTSVVMPQMGESIAEGTIVRWIKKVGDAVDRDEPLFEISTDKVDAEIPAPVAGVLTEIKVKEGETVPVNSVVAMIGEASEVAAAAAAPATPTTSPSPPVPQADGAGTTAKKSAPAQKTNGREVAVAVTPAAPPASAAESSDEDARRQKSSPLVRRIAKEHNVDVSQIHGSGLGGRVTKHDILEYIESPKPQSGGPEPRAQGQEPSVGSPAPRAQNPEPRTPAYRDGDHVEIEPLSVMRKKIAEHMVMSRRTSAHVHSVFHVNFSTVARIRQQKKAEYEQLGTKLTYMAFIAKAVIAALRKFPVVNASLDGDNIVYKKDINLGVAVALEGGLIVPVIKHADEKNLLGLSRSIADVAERARSKQLKPDEVHGGTFTITNPGQFGSQFGMPIINQPQVAILGVGTIEKRPVVVDDAIAIRTMAYLTLGYDHRLVDGATGDQFMSEVKQQIENFDINQA